MEETKETPKKKKVKIPTESYTLLKDRKVGASGKEYKKGDEIQLTKKGAQYFASEGLIKKTKK